MEKLTNINQLTNGTNISIINGNISIINGEIVTNYEFLSIHPHNEKYILALESCSQEGHKLYIPSLLERSNVYVGKFDSKFIYKQLIEYHKNKVEHYTKLIEK